MRAEAPPRKIDTRAPPDAAAIAILVRSARPKRQQRNGIRESWAKNASNVFFVVANQTCTIPEADRAQYWKCLPGRQYTARKSAADERSAALLDVRVQAESQQHADMVFADHIDAHRSSNAWLKQAYAWALRRTNARWFVKVDDDVYVHVAKLARWMHGLEDSWTIVGLITPPGPIGTSGKTSETPELAARYGTYPPWPKGSSGHVVTRDIARYVSKLPADAPSFHGEDVSMGLWMSALDEPRKVRWIHAAWEFSVTQACRDQSRLITGHTLKPQRLRFCASSPCLHGAVGKGTGCGVRRIRPLPERATFPRCALVAGGVGFAAPAPDAPCEFRLLGRKGAREDSGWKMELRDG